MIRKRMSWPLCISWLWNQILLLLCFVLPQIQRRWVDPRSRACFRSSSHSNWLTCIENTLEWRRRRLKSPWGWLSGLKLNRGFDRKLVKIRERWPCVFLSDKIQLLFLKLSQKTTLWVPLFLSMNDNLAKRHNLSKSGFLTLSTSPKRPWLLVF